MSLDSDFLESSDTSSFSVFSVVSVASGTSVVSATSVTSATSVVSGTSVASVAFGNSVFSVTSVDSDTSGTSKDICASESIVTTEDVFIFSAFDGDRRLYAATPVATIVNVPKVALPIISAFLAVEKLFATRFLLVKFVVDALCVTIFLSIFKISYTVEIICPEIAGDTVYFGNARSWCIPRKKIEIITQKIGIETYKNGDTIITEGETGDKFYIVKSGKVDISVKGKYIRTLGEKEYFGERALFFNEARSATATSKGDVQVFYISQQDFKSNIEDNMKEHLMNLSSCMIMQWLLQKHLWEQMKV